MSGTIPSTALELGFPTYAEQVGAQYGLPSGLMSSVIQNESGWNSDAVNSQSGATGIMQFLPSTAANPGYGVQPFNPSDPYASMSAAAQYISALQANTGSLGAALNQYSGGASYASKLASQYGGSGGASTAGTASSGTGTVAPASTGTTGGGWMATIGHYTAEILIGLVAIVVIGLGVFYLKKRGT